MPTVYVSNWSSHRTAGHHGPGRKLSIMARPRAWEVGDCVGRKKAPGVILTGSRAAVVRAARFLARKVRLHGVGS